MNLLAQHPAFFVVGAYWFFSAVVGGMPEPGSAASPGYKWLYSSLHILAGNLSTAVESKFSAAILNNKGVVNITPEHPTEGK